jgi:tetratricopeptide (TPR) repeat protein
MNVEGDAKATNIAIHLNKALCYQKLNNLDEVRHSCDEVLKHDPNSVKAYYRRGQANFSLGETDKALADFEKCLSIEPENKAALNQSTICKQKLKQYRDQEKKIYANMFSKFAAFDTHRDQELLNSSEFSKAASFGEWKDEERSHSITKFEEENPDL